MRSEERSGIIAIALILLWGTLITEPFRYFAEFLSGSLFKAFAKAGSVFEGKLGYLLVSLAVTLICCSLLKLSSFKAGHFIGCGLFAVSMAVFLIRGLKAGEMNKATFITMLIFCLALLFTGIFKQERILIWFSDAFIFALPMSLLSAWVLRPIASLSGKVGKYLFVVRKSHENFASAFRGFLTVPALVWGIFFCILSLLPVIYLAAGRRKG